MRAFKKEDISEINSWLLGRDIEPLDEIDIPKYGMIEPEVAAGFVCFTDTTTCFLEVFLSNPFANKRKVSQSIMKIAKWGLRLASTANMKRCLIITNNRSLKRRAKSLGFGFKDCELGIMDFRH